jgi:DNA-binding NtrC family response regulator
LPEHLPKRFFSSQAGPPTISLRVGFTLEETEKEMIAQTLAWTNNNRQRSAAILGISRRTLYNKISKYDL